jgi:hypothetical protein
VTAATSAIVKEEHQRTNCIYCGAKLNLEWKFVILDGLEYKVTECEQGCKIRIRTTSTFTIDQFAGIHRLDWGKAHR